MYLDLYRNQPQNAQKKALLYQDYPVDAWRERFNAVLQMSTPETQSTAQEKESQNTSASTDQKETNQSLEMKVVGHQMTLNYQGIKHVNLNLYPIDLEVLFSESPLSIESNQNIGCNLEMEFD